MTERVAIYARLSQDPTGKAINVADQLERGRLLAEQRGYRVVGEFSDNDISAFRGKRRPEYERLCDLARRGKVDRVICFHLTRITRNRRERAEFIESFATHGVNVSEVGGQDYNLGTAAGRGMADIMGWAATWESEVKSERVTAANERRCRQGLPSGGLGYGWTKTLEGYEVDPEQAAVVREITDRLLSGDSLTGITADLNERGVPGPKPSSNGWGKTSVRKIATRHSNAGLRVHHKGKPDEQVFPGAFPALVAEEKWRKVVALLGDPARRDNGVVRPGARVHLLSWGLGECGVCGGKLRVAKRGSSRYGVKQPTYICDEAGCVGRNEAKVDAWVREVVAERLSRPDALDWLRGDDEEAAEATRQAADLRERLDQAADDYADGKIDSRQLERITARLRPRLEEAEAARLRHAGADTTLLEQVAGPKARERWDELGISQRRRLLEILLDGVVLRRTGRRGPGFDPDSVEIRWREI